MIEVLQSYTDAKQERHIDPTFLLSSNRWRELEKEYPIHRPYILVFPLYWDASFNKELKALHKKTGKDIIVLSERKNSAYATKRIYDADVRQFLWLLDHADAVVSSSFHGVALSLILEKPLAAVINPAAPSRITSILSCLNYKNLTIGDLADGIAPEYSSVNQKISEETERSIRYLREVLEIEKFEQPKPKRERKLTPREQQMNRPLFASNFEKYEWLMNNGCTNPEDRKWLTDYIRSDEYMNLYGD